MKGNAIIITGDKKTMSKAAAIIYTIGAPRALEAQKYTPLHPEIKQHEQYGWYRKFDTKKKY